MGDRATRDTETQKRQNGWHAPCGKQYGGSSGYQAQNYHLIQQLRSWVSTTEQLPTLMISEAPVTTAAAQEHPECSQVDGRVNKVYSLL